jgi:predicted DNA-binding transcriptional regulator YafY
VTPDTDKLVRQLSLVAYLMAERRSASARDVKQAVEGYSEMSDEAFARRFYADRSELLALGVPLESQRDDFTGEELYTLLQERYFLPGLNLSDAELAALSTAVHLLDGQFAYAEPLRLALQNLALGRPNPSYDAAPEVSVRLLGSGFTAEVAVRLQKLETAISKQRTVVFRYWAISSDEEAVRTVDPYSLYLMGGHWYVIGRDHDRDDVRTFRLDRVRGDVRFATRRERDFRVPAEFNPSAYRNRAPWQLGDGDEQATILVEPEAAWLVERAVGQYGTMEHRDDRSLLYTTTVADWHELAGWLIGLDGLASPLAPPELVERVAAALERVAADHEGEPQPHAVPLELVDRVPAPERGESPVTPERFAVLQAMLADVLAACGEQKDANIDAAQLAERFKLTDDELEDHLQLLNLVNFGGGCYAVYAERTDDGRTIHVEKELYGDEFRRPARLSPLEAKALLLALDLVGPLVAADAGTTLDDVRAKLEAAFGRYDMRGAPTPQPTALDEDVLSVLSAAIRNRTLVEIEYLGRQAEAVTERVVEPHYLRGVRGDWYCDTWDRTATPEGERTFRVDRIRAARAIGETFERRESLTERVDGALGDHAGTASFWFSAKVARWELEDRADTSRLADGAALASVPYGSERWLCAEICRYLGEAILLEPEALRVRVATRARELAALVRAHSTASTP